MVTRLAALLERQSGQEPRQERTRERMPVQSILLDIGETIGALIVYTSAVLVGREIEVSPKTNAARRTHTEVLERRVGERTVYAAVFASLTEGQYSLWRDVLTDHDITITGGAIAEVDWQDVSDPFDFREAWPERRPGASFTPVRALPEGARSLLPARYQQGQAACATPMGAAPLRYTEDGQVAWDQLWTDFCDLALAGGPRHRESLLEPPSPEEVLAAPDEYRRVIAEVERGLRLVTELPIIQSDIPGWIGLQCDDETMARWLLLAISEENVSVRREGSTIFVPVAPTFQLEREIKNIVTVVAKTNHYWQEHRDD